VASLAEDIGDIEGGVLILVIAGAAFLVWTVYNDAKKLFNPPGGGAILPTGNVLDWLYNAATGKLTASQQAGTAGASGPTPTGQTGQASGLDAFNAAGRSPNDTVPGTGQTAAELYKIGYSWDDINAMFNTGSTSTDSCPWFDLLCSSNS
jgi:hypothetical protein